MRIKYTHFFDGLHKLFVMFAPWLIILLIALMSENSFSMYLIIITGVILTIVYVLFAFILDWIPTYLYVLSILGIRLNSRQSKKAKSLIENNGKNWKTLKELRLLNKNDRRKVLFDILV